jgi:hypothetical protein
LLFVPLFIFGYLSLFLAVFSLVRNVTEDYVSVFYGVFILGFQVTERLHKGRAWKMARIVCVRVRVGVLAPACTCQS